MLEISGGECFLLWTSTQASPLSCSINRYETDCSLLLHLRSRKLLPHQALDRVNRIFRICGRLALGHLADQAFAAARESDDRGRGARALGVGNDPHLGFARGAGAFEHCNARVGRAEIDPDDLPHGALRSRIRAPHGLLRPKPSAVRLSPTSVTRPRPCQRYCARLRRAIRLRRSVPWRLRPSPGEPDGHPLGNRPEPRGPPFPAVAR